MSFAMMEKERGREEGGGGRSRKGGCVGEEEWREAGIEEGKRRWEGERGGEAKGKEVYSSLYENREYMHALMPPLPTLIFEPPFLQILIPQETPLSDDIDYESLSLAALVRTSRAPPSGLLVVQLSEPMIRGELVCNTED